MAGGRAVSLAPRFADVRAATASLCAPLETEDYVVQSMPDASPAKWHLAHTTWFFEQFVLVPHLPAYCVFDDRYSYLFNSYYEAIGPRHRRPERGLLSRPTVDEVRAYREHVDEHVDRLLHTRGGRPEIESVVELGLQHEQQHQELILTDVKHLFWCNPLKPAYRAMSPHPNPLPQAGEGVDPHPSPLPQAGEGVDPHPNPLPQAGEGEEPSPRPSPARAGEGEIRFHSWPEGIYEIGHAGEGFCFDNETPRHRVFLAGFRLAERLITNAEYLEFIRDGGYRRPELWVSDGWATVQSQSWTQPLYWSESLDSEFTLAGMCPLDPDTPVCHVSWYETDAFARWAQARLPTEAEWEVVASREPIRGNFLESNTLHPRTALTPPSPPSGRGSRALTPTLSQRERGQERKMSQLFGDLWEWTSSAYSPYPGYRPLSGALGEYNGKFMANQFVLRGGSCATPATHIRSTYRNFFYPHMRWQFAGIRLAKGSA